MTTIAVSNRFQTFSGGRIIRSHSPREVLDESDGESVSPAGSDRSSNCDYQEGETPPSPLDQSSGDEGFPFSNTNKETTSHQTTDRSPRRPYDTVPITTNQRGLSVTSHGVSAQSTKFDGRGRRPQVPSGWMENVANHQFTKDKSGGTFDCYLRNVDRTRHRPFHSSDQCPQTY